MWTGRYRGGLAEAEAVAAGPEVGLVKGRVAALQLLRQVPVEPLGSAGRRGHAVLFALQKAQVMHLLGHSQPGFSGRKTAAIQ